MPRYKLFLSSMVHWPAEFLESRRAFFLFVHIAYELALGRRPASSHPLIVHAQHGMDDVRGQAFG